MAGNRAVTVTWKTYDNNDIQAESLADLVTGQLCDALAKRGRASLAVPGGATPRAFLSRLSLAKITWQNVDVMLSDERFVPESAPRSNTRLLRQTLLKGPASAAHLVPLYAPAKHPEDVLDSLEAGIRAVLPLDVCVLGMGADMHTASLFATADNLALALAFDGVRALLPMRVPGVPEARLTLTAPVLRSSRHLHILIHGADKLAALKRAQQDGPLAEAPVRAILSAPNGVTIHYS